MALRHYIDRTPYHYATKAEAAEHNRRLAWRIAPLCSTMQEVDDLAIELSGHLPHQDYVKFRELAWSVWFDYKVAKICAEVAGE